jgi:hypothetical protein
MDRTSAQPQVKLILLPSDRFSNKKHEILTEPFLCFTLRDIWGRTVYERELSSCNGERSGLSQTISGSQTKAND